ncbi:hypothetical protein UFOVP731_3 [uncultured Caudovirales phage]|uniref:Uncharacterized protein n=1 Tax=uncultured Caudovirales phage TaxID=2100421 RepID=A0A6J5NNQ7_9CAUD|nr:hypothetical protein UFOVP731_3 [uncultured Caudovirales phage]
MTTAKTISTKTLQERSSLSGKLIVDRERAIISNVKVLGFNSLNGRKYLPEALKSAVKQYEGVMVNVNHPEGDGDEPRSAYDRCGKLKNVRYVEGAGIYADLHLLKSHPITECVLDAAETMPEAYGLSHNAKGDGEDDENGVFVVQRIVDVRHVDLVADPATTRGLSESRKAVKLEESDRMEKLKPHLMDVIDSEGLSTEEKVAKILGLLDLVAGEPDADNEDETSMEADGEIDSEKMDDKKEIEKDTEEEEEYPNSKDEEKAKKDDMKATESRDRRGFLSDLKAIKEDLQKAKTEMRKQALIRKCEESRLPVSKDLLSDLIALPSDSVDRHIKRLAEAHKASKPRTMMPIQEGSAHAGVPKTDVSSWLKD